MGHMPAIPASTRSSILLRLLDHAEKNWPQLKKVQARYRGPFAWITGVLPDGEQIPLFRLRYGGSAHSFGFAIYSAASDRYEDAVLITGLPVGTPQEALDTACTVHLAGLGHEPSDRPPTLRQPCPHLCAVPLDALHMGSAWGLDTPKSLKPAKSEDEKTDCRPSANKSFHS